MSNLDVNQRDKDGKTGLWAAAATGNLTAETVEALLKNGADINAADKLGRLPVTIAQLERHTNVVNILRAKGAEDDSYSLYFSTRFSEHLDQAKWETPNNSQKVCSAIEAVPPNQRLNFIITLFLAASFREKYPNAYEVFEENLNHSLPEFGGMGFGAEFKAVMLLLKCEQGQLIDTDDIEDAVDSILTFWRLRLLPAHSIGDELVAELFDAFKSSAGSQLAESKLAAAIVKCTE